MCLEKAADNGARNGTSATHIADLDGVLLSWLWPGPMPVIMIMWTELVGERSVCLTLSLSACLPFK